MSILAYRVTAAGYRVLSMRTQTYEGMARWLAASIRRRRFCRKLMWVEEEGRPAHGFVLAPRARRVHHRFLLRQREQ